MREKKEEEERLAAAEAARKQKEVKQGAQAASQGAVPGVAASSKRWVGVPPE
jgi:hypothetical protein